MDINYDKLDSLRRNRGPIQEHVIDEFVGGRISRRPPAIPGGHLPGTPSAAHRPGTAPRSGPVARSPEGTDAPGRRNRRGRVVRRAPRSGRSGARRPAGPRKWAADGRAAAALPEVPAGP